MLSLTHRAICFCFLTWCAYKNVLLFVLVFGFFHQTVIMENEVLPKIFLDFLNIRHFPSVPKTESCGWVATAGQLQNRKSNLWQLLFVGEDLFPGSWRTMWPDFFSFMVFSSFDTESMESRWVISSFLLCINQQVICLCCTLLSQCVTYDWTPSSHLSFFWCSFAVNCLISQSWCTWEIRTCCPLHTVRSTYSVVKSICPFTDLFCFCFSL